MAQYAGSVVWFNNVKGYGFLRHESGEVFVHYSAIHCDGYKKLNEDQAVEFDIVTGSTGKPQADNVRPLS